MAKKLLIVESPAKARTIGGYLGSEYEVLASVGHVRDLPKSSKNAINIEKGFTPNYVVAQGKKEVIEKITRAAERASEVLLATDPDREGEAIAWHIEEAARIKNPKRVVFHEITKDAILDALTHPRTIDQNLRKAQEARRVLDRLVGYDLSAVIWKKVRYGLSAGRVQSPALRILCEREREIEAFVPEIFFTIEALFETKNKEKLSALCAIEPKTKEEAERIEHEGKKASWKVSSITQKEEERAPRPPFTTSTLQQSASTRLGFSASRTMRAAQKLYEAGHITYMRTDSVSISKEAVARVCTTIEKEFGKDLVSPRVYKTKSKNAQEAHEAIRPTHPEKINAGAPGDEQALYELIRVRTLASQMKNARALRTKVEIIADTPLPLFSTSGSHISYPGWLLCDTRARGEDTEVPILKENEPLALQNIKATEKQTEPPNRYTEAGLIKELEKRGIGRPSTYASIMQTLEVREYVEKKGRTLYPTKTGMVVSGFLEEHFSSYISDSFTAEMEDELDEIARGEREYKNTLQEFYTPFLKAIKDKDSLPKATSLGKVSKEFPCPLCGSEMEFKLGRGGVFMSCVRYPDCEGARQENGDQIKADEPLGIHPETKLPIFVRTGRYGAYVEMPLEEKEKMNEEEETTKKKKKSKKVVKEAKRASIPQGKRTSEVTLEDAVHYLSLPRELGLNPQTGMPISANTGRYGPYVAHNGEFRSIKKGSDPYTISFEEALALLNTPKAPPKGAVIVREVGKHPKTGKMITLFKSKQGFFLKKGLRRVIIPDTDAETLTPHTAAAFLASS